MATIQLAERVLKTYDGEVEIEIRDLRGNIYERRRERNIVKIFAKEILSHRLPYSKVWDPNAGSGAGDWVTHNIDLNEFSAKYIVFGASFDANGQPLDANDTRYYIPDPIAGGYVPITLGTGIGGIDGAGNQYDELINPIPIAEPYRPLKRIERIYFEPSYQPAGTPLLQPDVRAINNIVVLETTLRKEEYNGFGLTNSDFFTLTEVALVSAAEVGSVGACECNPRSIFLTPDTPLLATASGTSTINLDPSVTEVDLIKEGDQIKIVALDYTATNDAILGQLNPYYLVINKALGGRDITLDRTPVTIDNTALTGAIGVLRDGFRIFSQRILKSPVKKSEDFEIVVRWRINLD